MANVLSSITPEIWSRRMQENRQKLPVYTALASREEQALLTVGDTLNRSFHNNLAIQKYTKNTDLEDSPMKTTNEKLEVTQTPAISFVIDEIDKLQNNVDAQVAYADNASKRLAAYIDADVLKEIVNANSVLDASDFGGTAGDGVVATTSNVLSIFTRASAKLARKNVDLDRLHAVLGPTGVQVIRERLDGKDTPMGDEATRLGLNGRQFTFAGFTVHMSNNLRYTATWTPDNNPSNGDTLTIGPATFKFVTTGSAADPGDVSIGATTSDTLDNLVLAIQGTGTPGASTYVGFPANGDENIYAELEGLTAEEDNDTLKIDWIGGGEVHVAASEAADVWSDQLIHWFFAQQGAVEMVEQIDARMKEESVQKQFAGRIMLLSLYGLKTFKEGADAMVQVKVDASGF